MGSDGPTSWGKGMRHSRCTVLLVRFGFLVWIGLLSATSVMAQQKSTAIEEAAERIDQLLAAAWHRDEITPAAISNDEEFCRRVWLDLAGVAPPVYELREFLADTSDDKRQQLIDRLLASPGYARHMSARWIDILLPSDAQTQLQQRDNVLELGDWLHEQFRDNTPYDYFVGGFLTAGGAGDAGPAVFYTSHELAPEKLAAATSQIFMGIQLQCAQCHNHPSDRWTQEDFWQYAAFFGRLSQTDGRMAGQTVIEDKTSGEVMLPDTEDVMSPRYPGIEEPPGPDPGNNRRRQLTIWMASRDNPYFARAAVNRVWDHLFGRGIVDPVDSMDADNKPSHPELLEYLAAFLVQQRFDLRDVYAAIARTDAYQRTSEVVDAERPPSESFAAMQVKSLTARQFYDSLHQNVYCGSAISARDRRSPDNGRREQFLARMRAPGTTPRDYPHGVVQALGMMNGPEVGMATDSVQSPLLGAIEAPFFDDTQRIETLFLATLSRLPTEDELQMFGQHLSAASNSGEKASAFGDMLWALLNTAECAVCP